MKPAKFEFARARSLGEAATILRQASGSARVIAGGQSLGPMLNLRLVRPSVLLDITAIPVLKELTHLPVIVDPSHAAGRRSLVEPLSLAAAAAGADGIIVEVHPRPEEALCDGPQQIPVSEFPEFADEIRALASLMGRAIG